MNISHEIWEMLSSAIATLKTSPTWLKDQANLSWEAMSQLPVVDDTTVGQHAMPIIEQKTVTLEYLDFLREQIRLNARGDEWSAILQNRLNLLEPFEGKLLIVATFFSKPHSATLRVCPDSKVVIYTE